MTQPTIVPRRMTSAAFAAYGVDSLAYVKPVRQDGHTVFEIYGADGTALGTATDRDAADSVLREHDMEPLSVH